jgi:hypothetical protein
MATPIVEKIARKTGHPIKLVERHWLKAKRLADKRFGSGSESKSSDYYEFASRILQNTLSVSTLSNGENVGGFFSNTEDGNQSGVSRVRLGGAVMSRNTNRGKNAKKDSNGNTWWDRLSREQQRDYLIEHPEKAETHKMKPSSNSKRPASHKRSSKPSSSQAPMATREEEPELDQDGDGDEEQQKPIKPIDVLPNEVPEEVAPPTTVDRIESRPTQGNSSEPESLHNINSVGRGLIHSAVSKGLGKLTHITGSKKVTFKGGLHALKKFSNNESMSDMDKKHLKDMSMIVMAVVLSSAVAFGPFMPFAGPMAHMYLDQITSGKKKKVEDDDSYEDDYEPPALDEPELSNFTTEEQDLTRQLSADMADFAINGNENLLSQVRSMHDRGN